MKQITHRILTRVMVASLFASIAGIWSCDPVYELPVEPTLTADAKYLIYGMDGGSQSITFTANRAWTAKLLDNQLNDSVEWCSLSSAEGKEGTHTITISVISLDGDYREAFLILNCSGAGAEIPVMQSGIPIVTAEEAASIYEAGATLTGNWYYSGEIDVTEIGFAIAEESSGNYTNIMLELDSISQGTFSEKISDLLSETTYLFKFYVKTASGEYYYSEAKTFTTDVVPVHLEVKDLVARGKALAVGGSQEQTLSEFIAVSISYVVEQDNLIKLSLVDSDCSSDIGEGKSVANYGIMVTIPSDSTMLGVYQVGDVLKVRTKGALLSNIDGNPLLALKDPASVEKTSTGYILDPVTVAHFELNDYLAMYVAIENTQVTKSYLDEELYPSWSNTVFTMEVSGSEQSYSMQVPDGASFAADSVLTGSGTLKGIVNPGQVGYLVNPRSASDLAGLSNDRFVSLLELRFLDPVFVGELTVGKPSTAYISLPYINGDGSTLTADISVTMSGTGVDSLGADPLEVIGITDPTVGIGIGELRLEVTGTPVVKGEIIFSIVGFDAYLSNTTVNTTVITEYVPVVGNFEVVWDVSTCNYATSMAYTTNTNPDITVTDLIGVNFNGSGETTKYLQDFATTGCDANTDENRISEPYVYLTTSLTVAAGKVLHLSGMDITCRTNGGDSKVSFQYSFDGTNFTEFDYFYIGSIEPTTLKLGEIDALKNVVEGSTVTFRIVPVNPISTAKWGISGKSTDRGLAIYGDVE